MLVNGKNYQSVWRDPKTGAIYIIDQRWLPHEFSIQQLSSTHDSVIAIRDMWVRGAPLIGITAAYGMAIAMAEDPSDSNMQKAGQILNSARPTAINLAWAISKMQTAIKPLERSKRATAALMLADQ